MARLLLDEKMTVEEVSRETGLPLRTIYRRKSTPKFLEYQAKVRAEEAKKLAALETKTYSALQKLNFDKSDLAVLLLEIARTDANETGRRYVDQVNAARLLADLLGWMPKPGAVASPDAGADAPPKPDIYQAEWMRKPQ